MSGVVVVVRAVEDAPEFERLATDHGLRWSSFSLPRFYHVDDITPDLFPFRAWEGIEIIELDDAPARGDQAINIPEGVGGQWPLVRHTSRARPWNNEGLRLPLEIDWTPPVRQGSGVDIYIIDTGVEVAHPEFGGRATIVYEFESTGGVGDNNGHGTAVAACAAGQTCGFARDSLIWSCKGLGSDNTGTATNLLNAMGAALSHYEARTVSHPGRPAVVNISWTSASDLYAAAAVDMMNAGMILVAAAANDRLPLASAPRYPACTPGVICVGGTQLGDVPYDNGITGTNYGLEVDVLAGGQNVYSATLRSLGVGDYRIWSGTSFSSPYTAGAIACMLMGHVRPNSFMEQQAVGVFVYDQATFGQYIPALNLEPMTPAILYLDPLASFQQIPGLESAGIRPSPSRLEVKGRAPVISAGSFVYPPASSLKIDGLKPSLSEFSGAAPGAGALAIEGLVPDLVFDLLLDPAPSDLRLTGSTPGVFVGVALTPGQAQLQVIGLTPVLFTVSGVIATQAAVLGLGRPAAPPARASQLAALALAEPPPPPTRSSQVAMLTIGEIVPDVQASQVAILALGHGSDCISERCQIWKITRRDGRVFRYTSHDRAVRYGGEVYKACRSLNPSASENASTLGSVGNIELTGIIDDEGISEADLYGGLFDDAFVTVDLITWGVGAETPRRLAAGWTGSLSQGETSFNMEVLGPGARLEQQALVQMVTPGCRWVFGSKECGVDIEAMKISGAVVSALTRGSFTAALPVLAPGPRQWENGRVRWTSGVNAGQITETKTVDFDTGEIVLWSSPAFLASAGDTFDVLPGCDFNRDGGCTAYANTINFGGFPDLPGSDALLETPVAKY